MSRFLSKLWPRRALFYTPGSDLRKLNKISKLVGSSAPDFIALDIEDGVAINAKDEARRNICENYSNLLKNRDSKTQIGIRLNSVSSNLLEQDFKIFSKMNQGQVKI